MLFGALLLLAILPAVFMDDNPQQLRAAFILGLQLAAAWGFVLAWERLQSLWRTVVVRLALCTTGVLLAGIGVWLFWQPGYVGDRYVSFIFTPEIEQVVHLVNTRYANYTDVRFVDFGTSQPYIFLRSSLRGILCTSSRTMSLSRVRKTRIGTERRSWAGSRSASGTPVEVLRKVFSTSLLHRILPLALRNWNAFLGVASQGWRGAFQRIESMVHPRESLFRPLLLCVIVLAALLRFVQLGSIPYGVNVDEAERAYEAYSLLKTGHDQHGHPWPVMLEAFSKLHDNASAISAYAAIPFTALLGSGVLAVRIPSAIAGIISVIAMVFLARRLSGDWRVGLLAGVLLAVSPWHLTVSRTGHEAIWTSTLFLLGAWVYFTALDKRRWLLPLAVIAWGVGFYGYGPWEGFYTARSFGMHCLHLAGSLPKLETPPCISCPRTPLPPAVRLVVFWSSRSRSVRRSLQLHQRCHARSAADFHERSHLHKPRTLGDGLTFDKSSGLDIDAVGNSGLLLLRSIVAL